MLMFLVKEAQPDDIYRKHFILYGGQKSLVAGLHTPQGRKKEAILTDLRPAMTCIKDGRKQLRFGGGRGGGEAHDYKYASGRGVWGHAPPLKFIRFSEITSKIIFGPSYSSDDSK